MTLGYEMRGVLFYFANPADANVAVDIAGSPASRKYAQSRAGGKGGWILRAEAFLSPRFHLTEAGFRERVAAWG